MICQWGQKNNLVFHLNEDYFLAPLADHFACVKPKLS